MIHQIKTFSEQANVNLDETYSKVKGELESEINMLSGRRVELEKIKGRLQSATEIDREHQFVQVKLCQKTINESKGVNAKFESHGDISIEFAECTNSARQLLEVKTFGSIKEARVNRKREIKCQKEIIVKKQNDQNKCRIMDVLQLDSGVCILADTANKKVKVLDSNHNVTGQFNVGGIPTGVCRTGHNEVAVKLTCSRIDILSVGTLISRLRNFSIEKGGEYWGIVYTSGNFWVSTGKDIDVYDSSGTRVKSISRDEIGQKSTIRQMTVYQNSVYVADGSDGIVCLESDGSKKTEFRDSRLTRTVGVCVSSDGTVYAIDEQSNEIVMFNQDGKCLGEMAPEVPSEKLAESLCYDEKNDCIRIGYSSSDTVTVLYLND